MRRGMPVHVSMEVSIWAMPDAWLDVWVRMPPTLARKHWKHWASRAQKSKWTATLRGTQPRNFLAGMSEPVVGKQDIIAHDVARQRPDALTWWEEAGANGCRQGRWFVVSSKSDSVKMTESRD
mmetsp:Transcript_64099/g.134767  ORF Transcript_64099/g.134767 Transcript_64099/m.134767 type:complete len:123 (+) Transcript_64099:776-1144(+)